MKHLWHLQRAPFWKIIKYAKTLTKNEGKPSPLHFQIPKPRFWVPDPSLIEHPLIQTFLIALFSIFRALWTWSVLIIKVQWTAGVIDILRKIELPKNHKNMKLHYLKHDLITLLLLTTGRNTATILVQPQNGWKRKESLVNFLCQNYLSVFGLEIFETRRRPTKIRLIFSSCSLFFPSSVRSLITYYPLFS